MFKEICKWDLLHVPLSLQSKGCVTSVLVGSFFYLFQVFFFRFAVKRAFLPVTLKHIHAQVKPHRILRGISFYTQQFITDINIVS